MSREGHELLGEFVTTLPQLGFRKRNRLRLRVRQGADFSAHTGASAVTTATSDCSFAILSAVLLSDQPPQPKPTIKVGLHRQPHLAANASAILLGGLQELAWCLLFSPEMFRSNRDTRMGPASVCFGIRAQQLVSVSELNIRQPSDFVALECRNHARYQRHAGARAVTPAPNTNVSFRSYRACRRRLRCHLEKTETSERPRFTGSSWTSKCSPL